MDTKQPNFNEMIGNDAPAAADTNLAEAILQGIDALEVKFNEKFDAMEALLASFEGRQSMTERYLARLISVSPEFKAQLKAEVEAAMKGNADVPKDTPPKNA